jgi:coenzyme F420-0:L-glutamate ligase/coenzyme F420-1:gamma-L-glutamate ligase
MTIPRSLTLTAIPDLPEVQPGDDVAKLIFEGIESSALEIHDNDIFVIAQKIVSKSEGRLVNLSTVQPSPRALEIAQAVDKRPELVELILQESNAVLRMRLGTIIVEHKSGFVCANAGIDHSNVSGSWGDPTDWVLLLPEDADHSAQVIRAGLEAHFGKRLGVLIIDSYGRAWRNGIIGMSIGLSGIPALVDMRGKPDRNGYALRVTVIAAADELAAGASLMMGQAAEGTPVVLGHGFPYKLVEDQAIRLVRSKQTDLFR